MITASEAREYVADSIVQLGSLDLDLAFTDDEVAMAMKSAARDFNSLPAPSYSVCASNLPSDTNVFFDGIAQHLFLTWHKKLIKEDFDYSAGGVTSNLVAKRIGHAKELIKLHGDRFKEAGVEMRLRANLRNGYGQVG